MKKLIAICVVAIFVGFISIGDSYADMVVDDFESYSEVNPIVPTWAPSGDGWIFTENTIIHGGLQSMKFTYNGGWFDASKWMVELSDWTAVDTLSIYFRGASTNSAEKMYVCLIDDSDNTGCIFNDDPGATQATCWTNWQVPLAGFSGMGVNLTNVVTLIIGIGPGEGDPGVVYFDNIELFGPPANDDCADAESITNVTVLAFDTTNATFDGPGSCQTAPNIWYCYTASCTGNVTVSLCGSSYDTMLAVYDGCGCDLAPFDMIECNDDTLSCSDQSEITFSASAGNQYLIEVGGFGLQRGHGFLNISCQVPPTHTPAGSEVTVSLEDNTNPGTTPVTLVFEQVEVEGETSLYTSDSCETPPVGFQLGDPATYYEITTTANNDGSIIVVCIDYSGVSYSDPELLRLHHYEDGAWLDRTISNDTINQIICGEVTSLSPFAVFQGDPKQLIQQLVQQVIDLNLQSGVENSLDAKLDAALKTIDDLNANNDVAAINSLSAFINAIEAQRGKKLTEEQADLLIADAQAIIDLLTGE